MFSKMDTSNLQLQTGHNHSCHHPRTHKINTKEIARNPSALHNTQYKKMRRREMLTGKRPEECDYCWNVEDNSDRFLIEYSNQVRVGPNHTLMRL